MTSGAGGSSSSTSGPPAHTTDLQLLSACRGADARLSFLAGVAHLVPVAGQAARPNATALLWSEAAAQGADLRGPLRALREEGSVRPTEWEALARAVCEGRFVRLALHLCGACVLPEAIAEELRTWVKKEASVADLSGMPTGESSAALRQMADALANDTKGIEDLLGRSREVFRDLAEMMKVATIHLGQAGQEAIEEVKASLDRDLDALNKGERYVLFGGLVSAGKTTLINALLLQLVPQAREELKEDRQGKLNLMPTSFNENTRIVTELELCPGAEEIEVRLLECSMAEGVAGVGTCFASASAAADSGTSPRGADVALPVDGSAPSLPEASEDPEENASPGQQRAALPGGFGLAEGYPVSFAGAKAWRKLQKRIRDVCEAEPPDTAMRRLHIRLPCGGELAQPVSIIDTPGLDSPTVWQQIRALVHTKAFLFVWVGALDSATAFGLQGRRLVDLYRSTGHPLPPVLVMTKWDRLKALPDFQDDEAARSEQAQLRLGQLRRGLLPPDRSVTSVTCTRPEDIEELVNALEASWRPSGGSDGGLEQQWVLSRAVAVGVHSVYRGSVLVGGHGALQERRPRTAEGEDEDLPVLANAVEHLQSLPLPAVVRFKTDESEALLLLASMNAAAVVSTAASPEQTRAEAQLASFWNALLPLLSGLSEPLRISRRLHKIVVGTQRVVNILLKDDQQAMVFEQNREDLEDTQRKVLKSFSDRVDQYFDGFPELARRPDTLHVPAGYRPKVSLQDYSPPEGLERSECAICLIPRFVREAHESAQHEKSQFRYVKAVATVTIERWQSKFLENMMRLERDCLMELQDKISELSNIHGLIDHSQWQADIQSLITSPIEAAGFGFLAGGLMGTYAGLIAEAVAGVGLGVGLGVGVLVAAGVAAVCFEDSALAKNLGVWTYPEAQLVVAQTVLDILNKKDFRAKAKELVMQEFKRRLQACMDQLADLRDPAASSRAEAQTALSIQARVAELQKTLGAWFSHFVGQQVGRDPWLVPPPADLRAALAGRAEASVATGSGAARQGAGGGGGMRTPDSSDDSDAGGD